MKNAERFYLIARRYVAGQTPETDDAVMHDRIGEAVPDLDARRAAGQHVDLFLVTPIEDADLYDWGGSTDVSPQIFQYTSESAARDICGRRPDGRVYRRRIGSDTWEEVAST